jgi:hypothetical protein
MSEGYPPSLSLCLFPSVSFPLSVTSLFSVSFSLFVFFCLFPSVSHMPLRHVVHSTLEIFSGISTFTSGSRPAFVHF